MEDTMVTNWKTLVKQQDHLFSSVVETNVKLISEISELRDQVSLGSLSARLVSLIVSVVSIEDRTSSKWSEGLEDTN